MNLNELATREIVRFHEQIGKWFRGEMSPNEKEEMMALTAFHAAFQMISPSGACKNRSELESWLPSVYAGKPGILVEVARIKVRFEQAGTILMEYEEYQSGGGTENRRISTALFVQTEEGGLQWYQLHETFLP